MSQPGFLRRILLPGFVFQSVVIAGGYGTGRELAEFFLMEGPVGGLLAMLVSTLLWSLVCAVTYELARAARTYDYRTFFQGLLGPGWAVYELAYLVFMLLILAVIAAASGSLLEETFGLPYWVGVVGIMVAVGSLVLGGSSAIEMAASYEDRSGVVGTSSESFDFDAALDAAPSTGVRKGVLLARYASLMREWISYERERLGLDKHGLLQFPRAQSRVNLEVDLVTELRMKHGRDSSVRRLPKVNHLFQAHLVNVLVGVPAAVVKAVHGPIQLAEIVQQQGLTQELADAPVVVRMIGRVHDQLEHLMLVFLCVRRESPGCLPGSGNRAL